MGLTVELGRVGLPVAVIKELPAPRWLEEATVGMADVALGRMLGGRIARREGGMNENENVCRASALSSTDTAFMLPGAGIGTIVIVSTTTTVDLFEKVS